MSLTLTLVVFVVSLAGLILASERLLSLLDAIGKRLGISEEVLAFFLIAVGTSLPELVSSVFAARMGDAELGVANLFGSNLTNSLLIAGVLLLMAPAMFATLKTGISLQRNLMLLASALALLIYLPWSLSLMAALLLAFAAVALLVLVKASPADESPTTIPETAAATVPKHTRSGALLAAISAFWLVAMVIAGFFTVQSVEGLATTLGFSATLAGLVFLALGTSLPELVTVIISVRQGKAGVAFANILGSNLINVSLILAITLFVADYSVQNQTLQTRAGLHLAVSAALATLLLALAPRVPATVQRAFALFGMMLYGFALWWSA